MAAGDFTLGIPGTGATDFATTPIPSLLFDRWTRESGPPVRGVIAEQRVAISDRSLNGIAQITGPAYNPKFIWPVAAMMTQAQARQLGAKAGWQDREFKAKRNGALRLIDEIEYLDSEPTPHSRTLLSAISEGWNSSYQYGYGVFDVLIVLPQDSRQLIGRWNDSGEEARLVTFTLLEV